MRQTSLSLLAFAICNFLLLKAASAVTTPLDTAHIQLESPSLLTQDRISISRAADIFIKIFPTYRMSKEPHCTTAESSGFAHTLFYTTTPSENIQVIELVIVASDSVNAFAQPALTHAEFPRIILTTELLLHLAQGDALAFVLAHEYAHLELEHFFPDLSDTLLTDRQLAKLESIRKDWEFAADRAALQTISRAGIASDAVEKSLRNLPMHKSHRSHVTFHPSIELRAQNLGSIRSAKNYSVDLVEPTL